VVLDQGEVLAPLWTTVSLQVAGIALQVVSKFCLGRSFGLLPANRGIVASGPYGLIRHPIYTGYFISHIGFLLASFSWRNIWLFSALYFFQLLRVLQEERLLLNYYDYQVYAKKVRWRFLPGIF